MGGRQQYFYGDYEQHSPPNCYTAKHMWESLHKAYYQDRNVNKVLQVEQEIFNLQRGDKDFTEYFNTIKFKRKGQYYFFLHVIYTTLIENALWLQDFYQDYLLNLLQLFPNDEWI